MSCEKLENEKEPGQLTPEEIQLLSEYSWDMTGYTSRVGYFYLSSDKENVKGLTKWQAEHIFQLTPTPPDMEDALQDMEEGCLNRKKLGGIVFADEKALLDLNKITHAAVKAEVQRRLASNPKLAAIDAIALHEGGLAELCDVTVAVTAPVEDRVQRLMLRDNISEEYARKRIAAQHEEGWFRANCQFVLENDGEMGAFATKCVAFLDTIGIM